jgi:UDP-glucose 4-epimerase
MKILVTGGAGYIGSFTTKMLLDEGLDVVVFDNLERGFRDAVDGRAKLIEGDIRDKVSLDNLFKSEKFDAVIHFAGYISVEESEKNPELYRENNVAGSENLFTSAIEIGNVTKFVFSSSAAVYGNPQKVPIPEDHPTNPTSKYGETKLATEQNLANLQKVNPEVSYACLRYFNASGAAIDGTLGERHDPETHIIPLALKSIIQGSEFYLYGTDYDTADGTCIRDYIHVLDLAKAHILTLQKVSQNASGYVYNVGTGKGYSNREVIDTIERIVGKKINLIAKGKREGDPEALVADSSKINKELGFIPKYSDLETIVKTAWQWHKNLK